MGLPKDRAGSGREGGLKRSPVISFDPATARVGQLVLRFQVTGEKPQGPRGNSLAHGSQLVEPKF